MPIRSLLLSLLALASTAAAQEDVPVAAPAAKPAATPSSWTGSVAFYLGGKGLNDDDWTPIESQGALGILSDFGPRPWPVRFAVNLIISGKEDDRDDRPRDDQGGTSELQLGVRSGFDLGRHVTIALSGGLAAVHATRTITTASSKVEDSDGGGGLWAAISADLVFGHFTFGPRFGLTGARATLFNQEIQAGGGHFGLFAGYRW